MVTLRMEHHITGYDGWKSAFDRDPIDRKGSGVRQYRIYRPVGQEDVVIIDLDFDHLQQAQSASAALQKVFPQIEGKLIFNVHLTLLQMIESKAL